MTFRQLVFLVLVACGGGRASDILSPTPTQATVTRAPLSLTATPSFADERGGGVFIDLASRLVRVRANLDRAALESHPANPVLPGPASAAWPLGPSTALVVTTRGVFLAESGWLIAPPWQPALEASGVRGATVSGDSIGWIAHEKGLFRLEGGQLGELQVNGASVKEVMAVAAAPAPDGHPGLWFAHAGGLSCASQTARNAFSVTAAALDKQDLEGGVVGLAGISASPSAEGELWVLTKHGALRFSAGVWHRYALGRAPRRVMAAGRFAWLEVGDALWRYDADKGEWLEASGLDVAPTLIAVDATGRAWARVGEVTLSLAFEPEVRLLGLYVGATVYESTVTVTAAFASKPSAISWHVDGAEPNLLKVDEGVPGTGLDTGLTVYAPGGRDHAGNVKPLSFASLADGRHAFIIEATVDGVETTRRVHFDYQGSATAVVSFERDIKPINDARCAKCHTTGTQPELKDLQQWKDNAQSIVRAVNEKRMPADGPLDPAGIKTISRWVTGGTQP